MSSVLLALLLCAQAPASVGGVAAGVVEPEIKPQPNQPAPGPAPPDEPGNVVKDLVAGGTHWRLETDKGPVHVWRPPGFDPRTAGILLYVHGYYVTADEAWEHHRLAEQFRASQRNAVFIVPEAPTSIPDRVRWADPEALFEAIRTQADIALPQGPVSAVGHSGAFRTLLGWLGSPRLEQIILLDGLYNAEDMFLAWLKSDPKPPSGRRMVIVGFETAERTEPFLANFPEALYRAGVPASGAQFKRREREAKVLYVQSQFDHMGLVTEGKAIPVLLRLSPFKAL